MVLGTQYRKFKSLSRYLVNSPRAGIPLEVFLILTDECNYHCRVCSLWRGIYRSAHKAPLSLTAIKSLADECSALGVPTFLISGGEPLLHPNILEITEYLLHRISFVRLNTNASLIDAHMAEALVTMGLQELWVSLDGIGEFCDTFRGVKDAYARTVAGIEQIVDAKRRKVSKYPLLLVDTIITPENLSMMPDHLRNLVGLGIDEVNLVHTCYVPPEAIAETERLTGRKQIYSGQFSTEAGAACAGARLSKSLAGELRSIAAPAMKLFIDPLLLSPPDAVRPSCRCLFPWVNLMVFSDGDACVCPLLDFVPIGNVAESKIMDIWQGPVMQEFRRLVARDLPICRHCICTRRVPMDHMKHWQSLRRVFS